MSNDPHAESGAPQPAGPPGHELAPGEWVSLPGRGRVFARVAPGPSADAPCLVLLHGLTATADLNWFAAFSPLSARYRVVAPDLRGHGGGVVAEPFTLEGAADDVAVLLGVLGVDRAVVVGYSMGGAVAQVLWRRHREVVAGLVLCATAADYRERTARGRYLEQPRRVVVGALGRVLPAGLRSRAVAKLRAASTASLQAGADRSSPVQIWAAGELDRSDPFRVAAAGAVLRRYVAADDLSRIEVPLAVVLTERDEVVPTADQRALVARLPDGTTVHAVASGHGAFVEDPERFVPALVAACDDVAARDQGRRTV